MSSWLECSLCRFVGWFTVYWELLTRLAPLGLPVYHSGPFPCPFWYPFHRGSLSRKRLTRNLLALFPKSRPFRCPEPWEQVVCSTVPESTDKCVKAFPTQHKAACMACTDLFAAGLQFCEQKCQRPHCIRCVPLQLHQEAVSTFLVGPAEDWITLACQWLVDWLVGLEKLFLLWELAIFLKARSRKLCASSEIALWDFCSPCSNWLSSDNKSSHSSWLKWGLTSDTQSSSMSLATWSPGAEMVGCQLGTDYDHSGTGRPETGHKDIGHMDHTTVLIPVIWTVVIPVRMTVPKPVARTVS